jgi:HCOMODA/2-hydroxy-3-carboxy-muconic semialdehyde decarboxylase
MIPDPAPAPALIAELVLANRILFRQGVVDGFGHVSARHDRDPGRFLLARSMAPALVTPGDIMEFDLDSAPLAPRGRTPYLERFIHGEIYRARPDVMAVVHSHSPAVIPFGVSTVPLRAVSHMGGFLGAGAPVFEIRDAAGPASDMLIRDRPLGAALARSLGVGVSIRHAVFRAVYTEMNARIAAEALRLGPVTWLTDAEAANVAAANDGQVNRAWDLWAMDAAPR